MKLFLKIILISLVAIASIGFSFRNSNQNTKTSALNFVIKDAKENYQNYCAGCHGTNLEEFVDRKWIYSENAAQISQIISNGIETEGMPAFAAIISNEEIKALTEYISAESKQQSIK